MSSSGAVTLGDIADKITMLEVSCSRCGRYGRLRVARLIERHGQNAKLPALRLGSLGWIYLRKSNYGAGERDVLPAKSRNQRRCLPRLSDGRVR
jgi:thymidine kinase